MTQMPESKKKFMLYFLKGEVAHVGEELFNDILGWCEDRDFEEHKIQVMLEHVNDLGSDQVVKDLVITMTEFFHDKQPVLNNYYSKWVTDEAYREYFS